MVESPLNIQRLIVEFLNPLADARQFRRLCGCKHCPHALVDRNRFFMCPIRGAHCHYLFLDDLLCNNRPACPVNHDGIRCDLPTHNGLTQSPGGINHHLVAFTGQRIGCEEDTGCLSWDEFLHHHRQAYLPVRDARSCAVANRARSPQRGPAAFDGIQNHSFSTHVEVGLLLTSKGQFRQILSSGRRTHRHG